MNVLVIDDEPKARNLLKTIIEESDCAITEVFEAENLKNGVQLIRKATPTVVFLDIEMPNELGTEIFNYFERDELDFEIVFTTAYDQYALKAFEMNAIDYILKPLRPKRVLDVLQRIESAKNASNISEKFAELHQSLSSKKFKKIGLPVSDGILFVPLKEVMHLEADGMYTTFYLVDDEKIVVSKPLKHFDYLLESGGLFYRPHRSHIINMHQIKRYVKKDGNYIVLDNDHVVPISKDKREAFLELIAIA
ncbi:MAG: LytTR family DNA-binding domain-containing protein [Crocinitomicaceae bacterium]